MASIEGVGDGVGCNASFSVGWVHVSHAMPTMQTFIGVFLITREMKKKGSTRVPRSLRNIPPFRPGTFTERGSVVVTIASSIRAPL